MNALLDLRILGFLLAGVGGVQVVPLLFAVAVGEPPLPWVLSAAVALIVGLSLALGSRPETPGLRTRDSFVVVTLGWGLASLFGAIPFVLTDVLAPVDALFESVAGFTTTGSSVMTNIEAAPRALLLWRSIIQWLGGMGIIVFVIAVLPLLGIGGMQLMKAELPGVTVEKLRPRVAQTARALLQVYIGISAAACLAYWLAGMGVFDAVCHALTTLSTGGFSTRNASLAAFHSPAIEWVSIVFMLISGMNFSLHYRLTQGEIGPVLRDAELRYFAALVVGSVALVSLFAAGEGGAGASVRDVAFQVASIVTTTGYATADYEKWPPIAALVLLQLMILGGMAGSTAGGVKGLRVVLGLKMLQASLARAMRPHRVVSLRYGSQPLNAALLADVWSFFTAYAAVALAASLVVAAAGYDLDTSISAALTALGNVGPGLGAVGPTDNFAHLPGYAKLTLAGAMIAGRLELFTVVVLLQRGFWRR